MAWSASVTRGTKHQYRWSKSYHRRIGAGSRYRADFDGCDDYATDSAPSGKDLLPVAAGAVDRIPDAQDPTDAKRAGLQRFSRVFVLLGLDALGGDHAE